jgi:hypothetical protein
MQQTHFMHSQSEIRFTKGNVVHFTRPRENNSIVSLFPIIKRIILFIVMVTKEK